MLVTGANGFIGKALTSRLLDTWAGLDKLTLLDLRLDSPSDPRVHALSGDLGNERLCALAFTEPVDVVFHLASVPGGTSERDPGLGVDPLIMRALAANAGPAGMAA